MTIQSHELPVTDVFEKRRRWNAKIHRINSGLILATVELIPIGKSMSDIPRFVDSINKSGRGTDWSGHPSFRQLLRQDVVMEDENFKPDEPFIYPRYKVNPDNVEAVARAGTECLELTGGKTLARVDLATLVSSQVELESSARLHELKFRALNL